MTIKFLALLTLVLLSSSAFAQPSATKDRDADLNKMRMEVATQQKKTLCKNLKEKPFIKEQDLFYKKVKGRFNFLSDWDFSRHAIFVDKSLWEKMSRDERKVVIAPMYTYAVCFSSWDKTGPTAHVINKDGGFSLSVDRFKAEGWREDYANLTR